jgi:hypothetical protein
MPCIRIEWLPVHLFGLGHLGFDHLQLVYEPNDAGIGSQQDDWYVMEGVREVAHDGTFLDIEGADGRTTLSVANLAAREDLVAKIGTPEVRGSRCLAYESGAFGAWETMASYARDIEQQDYPYIAYGLPGSPTPTINSSSAIASLIYYSGLDPSDRLPFGLHVSPGTTTLLGTGSNDILHTDSTFTTLLGGRGNDQLFGGSDRNRIEKFFGGEGDDLFHWSAGFNIIHGGQPGLDYAHDGTDVMDYSGAGTVHIAFNRYWIPHKVPSYVAVFSGGLDHMFSIERIQWNETTDRIVLGKGVDLLEDDAIVDPSAFEGRELDRSGAAHTRSATSSTMASMHRRSAPRPTTRSPTARETSSSWAGPSAAKATAWPTASSATRPTMFCSAGAVTTSSMAGWAMTRLSAAPAATPTSISTATATTRSLTRRRRARSTSLFLPAASSRTRCRSLGRPHIPTTCCWRSPAAATYSSRGFAPRPAPASSA